MCSIRLHSKPGIRTNVPKAQFARRMRETSMTENTSEPTPKMRIRSEYQHLGKKERRIADYVLADSFHTLTVTISDMSRQLDVAPSTITHFTKKLGYSGFREFKEALLLDEASSSDGSSFHSIHGNVRRDDSFQEIAQKVFNAGEQSLQETFEALDKNELEKAIGILVSAENIWFMGTGGANVTAYGAYHDFLQSPKRCHFVTDYHAQLMEASLLGSGDCVVIASHSVLSKDTLAVARLAKEVGAKIVFIVSYPSDNVRELADVILLSVSEGTGYLMESLSSRIPQIAILDTLLTVIMFQDERATEENVRRVHRAIRDTKEG